MTATTTPQRRPYITVSLPRPLYEAIRKQLDSPGGNPAGYRSVTEYLVDLVREDLRENSVIPRAGAKRKRGGSS